MDLVKKYTPATKTIVGRLENLEKCCEESKKFKLESEKKIDTLEKLVKQNRKTIIELIYSNERVRNFSHDMRYVKFLIDNFDFSQSVEDYDSMLGSLGASSYSIRVSSSIWIEYLPRGLRYLDDDRLEILFQIIDKYTNFTLNYINSNPSFWEGIGDKDQLMKKFERIFKRMKDNEDKSKGDDFPSDGRKRKNKSRRRSMKKKNSHKKKF